MTSDFFITGPGPNRTQTI